MSYVIGLDIGTSGTKAVLFDENLNVTYTSIEEYPLYQPENGWAEQDPDDWARASKMVLRDIVKNSGIPSERIKAIGLAGQMHGLVMLNKKDEVIRRSIIWADQRTARECEEITKKVGRKKLIDITANPALTGFTAAKILWVKNNEKFNYNRCRHILLPKDYVRFILTGDYATDVSDASGMQLLDVPKRDWSQEILDILEIDRKKLPKVYESQEITGRISKSIAKVTGLSQSTVLVAGAGDNAAAAVGTGVVKDGTGFTTIGTSGVVFAHTDELKIDSKGRVHTFCCAVPGAWHVMGVTQAAGLSLQWFKDNIYDGREEISYYDELNKDIEGVKIGSENLIFLPYLMGERTPHLDPNARGVFFGLSAKHGRPEMARSVMEGIAFSQKDSYDILKLMGIDIDDMMVTGGGARSDVLRGILSDMYDCNISTIKSKEGAALGAAILAGVGIGLYPSVEEACDKYIKVDKQTIPKGENHREYLKYHEIYKEIYKNLKGTFSKLNKL